MQHDCSLSAILPYSSFCDNSLSNFIDTVLCYVQTVKISFLSDNKREAKGNDSYFLLKKTSKPIVIVECGFLSNREEAAELSTPLYQEKMAWNIHMGVMKYLYNLHFL